jgi:hypothetical protein
MQASHVIPAIQLLDVVAPAAAALLFAFVLSRLREPVQRKVLAVMTAGFATAYLGGGLGAWELLYLVPASYIAYRALDSWRFIALGWLMHPVWDLVHHFHGNAIWPWMPTSSIGCAVFDPIVAIWATSVARSQGRRSLDQPQGPGPGSAAYLPRAR